MTNPVRVILFVAKAMIRRAILMRHRVMLRGDAVECTCCGGRFREFLPFGVDARPNVQCPRCGSLERHRILALYFQEHSNMLRENSIILHIAPESALRKLIKRVPNVEYIMSQLAPTRWDMVKLDVTHIVYPDDMFDAIICNHVLQHVIEDRKAMKELIRVLKPGGWAILQVPIDNSREMTFEDSTIVSPQDRDRVFGQWDHVRRYGTDYPDRLSEAGFRVTADDYVRTLTPELVERYRLNVDETIFTCWKEKNAAL